MEQLKWKQKFMTVAIGQTVSLVGSSAVQFALIWWIASETQSPLMLSLIHICRRVPISERCLQNLNPERKSPGLRK